MSYKPIDKQKDKHCEPCDIKGFCDYENRHSIHICNGLGNYKECPKYLKAKERQRIAMGEIEKIVEEFLSPTTTLMPKE